MSGTERTTGRRGFLRAAGGAGAAAALPTTAWAREVDEQRPRIAVVGVSTPDAVVSIDDDLPSSVAVVDRSERLRYVRVALPSTDGAYDRLRVESRVAALEPVKYVEYDEPMPVLAVTGAPDPESTTASGATTRRQHALDRVNASGAWDALDETGDADREVVVGVVDTGVDYEHDDLAPQFGDELGHDSVDRFLWGSPDDDPRPEGDDEYHGTHVAGITGAARDGTGVAGVADVTLRSYRAIGTDGVARPTDVASAVTAAVDDGADVINMSLGFPVPVFVVRDAVSEAVEEGALPVAAAGNLGDAPPSAPDFFKRLSDRFDDPEFVWYPAAYDDCVCVSALDRGDAIADYSKYGESVDVTAPGTRVRSTMPDDDYARLSGTSMASPVVAGVAALIKKRYPRLTVSELRQRLRDTARDVGLSEKRQGAGMVDALRGVTNGTVDPDSGGVTTTTYAGNLDENEQWTTVYGTETPRPKALSVELSGPADTDMDLYLTRDGSEPTYGNFDRRSWTVGSEERIEIENPAGLSSVGITVDAFAGGGSFEVTVTEQGPSSPALDVDTAVAPGTQVFAVDVPAPERVEWDLDDEGAVVTTDLTAGEHTVGASVDGDRAAATLAVRPDARAGHRRHVETYEGPIDEEARFVHEPAADADRVTVRVEAVDGPADLDLYAARDRRATTEDHDAAGVTVTDRERAAVDADGPVNVLVDHVAGDASRVRVVVEELHA